MQVKNSTREEYQKRINIIIEYINHHLDEDIELVKLAEMSNFSLFHFHRIAKAFLGEPIGAFITRVRVETAARLLRYTDIPVSEVAFRVGYDVPSSLSKTFQLFYGISPSMYRKDKNYTIMETQNPQPELKLKAPKIRELETKNVIYIHLTGKYSELDFCGTWTRLWGYVKECKLYSAGIEHISVYHSDPKVTEPDKLQTDICLAIHKPVKRSGRIGVKQVPGGKYAIFQYQGPYSNLGAVYDMIFSEWLPQSGEKLGDKDCFEKYLNNPENTEPEKLKTEIYLPLQ